MSRTVEWAEWKSRRRESMRQAAQLSERLAASRRTGSTRARSQEDVAMLTRMMRVEINRRVAEGRLVRLGPREYELHLRGR